jgi:multiple sugar transport system ATP-binding protein
MAMADRIVVMSNAAVKQIGTPADVYYEPANLFVANFIGSPGMNFLKGKYADGSIRLPGDHLMKVPDLWKDACVKQLSSDGAVIVGFRPEAGQVVSEGDVTGEVYAVDMNGSDNLLYLSLVDKTIIRVRVDIAVRAPIGTKVNISIDPKYIRFFNAETEATLKREA